MSNKAVFCLAHDEAHASRIVENLKAAGFAHTDISVLMPDKRGTRDFAHEKGTKAPEGATTGALTGGAIGGVLGWLTGIGALAIPGLGPLIAAGPIMAALSGAAVGGAAGGLVGALIGMGIPEYEAKRYEAQIKAGRALISVHSDNAEETRRAKEIFERAGAEGISSTSEERVAGDRMASANRAESGSTYRTASNAGGGVSTESRATGMRSESGRDANRDPISGSPGAHPVGTGVGAASGGAAGAAIGAVGGPVGAAVGLVVGAVAGGLAGKGIAETIDPTVEDNYWKENYSRQPYVDKNTNYETYRPAYRTGYEGYTRYSGKSFDEVEPNLQQEYERARGTSNLNWEKARPAARDAWQRVEKTCGCSTAERQTSNRT